MSETVTSAPAEPAEPVAPAPAPAPKPDDETPDAYLQASRKLIPADPASVMVIRTLTPTVSTLSVPFSRFGLFRIGGRCTIVKLQEPPSLAVFSPVALTPAVKTHLDSLEAPVKYLICPDAEHHIFLSTWARAFPSAAVIGPDTLAQRRAKSAETREPAFTVTFAKDDHGKTDKAMEGLEREFDVEFVPAHPNQEIVFFHRPSRSLIEADFFFNLPATEQYSLIKSKTHSTESKLAGLTTSIFNCIMRPAAVQKRFLWYLLGAKDKTGFGESVKTIDAWDWERIIPCHGDVLEGKDDSRKAWNAVMGWFLSHNKTN